MARSYTGALLIGLLPVWMSICGCSEKLEDGYEPHKLNATLEQRRMYYSAPYAGNTGGEHDSGAPQMGPGH